MHLILLGRLQIWQIELSTPKNVKYHTIKGGATKSESTKYSHRLGQSSCTWKCHSPVEAGPDAEEDEREEEEDREDADHRDLHVRQERPENEE